MNFRSLGFIFGSFLLFTMAQAAETCNTVFLGALQSHSSSGLIHMGYKSRVYGGGTELKSPRVTHTHNSSSNPDHSGLCDGQKCTATGTHSEPWVVNFETGTGQNGNLGTGSYKEPSLAVVEGDYANFKLGQEATARFTTANGRYLFKNFSTGYKSVLELGSGDYWVDGNLLLDNEVKVRFVGVAGQQVRIFVSGKITVNWSAIFENFTDGQLIFYSKGDIVFDSRLPVKAMLYAANKVTLDYTAKLSGSISAKEIQVGQEAEISYIGKDLVDSACGGASIHHYRLSFSSPLLSCQAIPVTVTACADAACSATVAQSNSITLTPSGRWIGGATRAFADSGSLVAYMTRVAGNVTLGLSGESYSCMPGNCIIDIRDSGFRIEVPDMIANKPDTATIQAVRKGDSSERCVADGGFAGKTKAVKFWSGYLDPDAASQVGDRPILLSDSAIAQSEAAATARNTSFDHNAQAKLPLNYTDSGRMQLNASYTGSGEDAGLLMSGSGSFVSRPYGLYLATDSTCLVAGVSGDCPLFTKAGDAFPVRIEARAWERDGEPLTAYELKDNIVTPNFRMAGIGLETELVAPSGGEAGVVTPASYGHALGEQSTAQVALSEVGVFRLRATPAASAYFGQTVGGGQSDLIGRIIPAWLEVDASDLSQQPGCPAPLAFTYQDQPTRLSGGLKVLGFGRDNSQTLNYRGDFWRVGTDQVYGLYRSDSAPASGEDAHVTPEPAIELEPENARLRIKGDYSYPRKGTPSLLDESFELKWVIWDLHDADNVYFSNREGAQITWGTETEGVPVSGLIKDSQLRLGQLRSENVRVPLGNSGQAPIMLEHWSGAAWQAATDNGCTTLATPVDTPEQLNFPDPGVTAAMLDAAAWDQSLLQVTATAPDVPKGSVLLRHLLRGNGANAIWLCQQRSEANAPLGGVCSYMEGGDAETRSSITFGIYQGSERLIFRREIYR